MAINLACTQTSLPKRVKSVLVKRSSIKMMRCDQPIVV